MTDCIFCQIIKGATPADKIYESDDFLVIKDIVPAAPVHLLIIPKRHIESLLQLQESDIELAGRMLQYTSAIADKYNLTDKGYKVVVNTGDDGGQIVPHLHYHFLGGKKIPDSK